jgi:hypothetical protein
MFIVHDIASNVTVSSSTTETEQTRAILWNEGRKVVELELLAELLYCNSCNIHLHLNDIAALLYCISRKSVDTEYTYYSWCMTSTDIVKWRKTNDYEHFEKGMIYMKILKKRG